ncbi:MAG: phosphonopyruvate decarboxylase [Acidimicrobiia bacterium]|nr:phosphonopyruvate decarboxylase [Acidimicrobiia bacterium]
MIRSDLFVHHLTTLGITMYAGVPDSLLKPFGQYVMSELPRESHMITADEGAAVGVAIGHYLRTSRPGLVYLQNSGFGNAINPLLSLADPDVYGVPMVLLVGWRGQPGVADEPQHVKQGRIMEELLHSLEIPFAVLPPDQEDAHECMSVAVSTAIDSQGPFVVLVEKGTFEGVPASGAASGEVEGRSSREDALAALCEVIGPDAIVVSTTGMLSRELFELRAGSGADDSRDFLTIGGMGHASAIALGVARAERERDVWCLDGDGALLMHMGTLASIADHGPSNFYHAVFNNGVHDSVGGQPTSIGVVDVAASARAAGYTWSDGTDRLDRIEQLVTEMRSVSGPTLLEIRVRPGARTDLGRPTVTPAENRDRFLGAIAGG